MEKIIRTNKHDGILDGNPGMSMEELMDSLRQLLVDSDELENRENCYRESSQHHMRDK